MFKTLKKLISKITLKDTITRIVSKNVLKRDEKPEPAQKRDRVQYSTLIETIEARLFSN